MSSSSSPLFGPHDSCPICFVDQMETPKALQCLHSFCEKCLQTYISSNAKRDSEGWYIHCPVCRSVSLPLYREHPIENGAAAFPTNFYINCKRTSLAPSRSPRHKNEEQRSDAKICSLCNDIDKKSEWICLPCKKAVCRECVFEHEKDGNVRHELHRLRDILAKLSITGNDPAICPDHVGNPMSLYCVTCFANICRECLIDTHYDCTVCFLRQDSEQLMSDFDNKTKQFSQIGVSVWHWSTRMGKHRDDIARKVTNTVDDIIASLEQKKRRILNRLDSLYKSQQEFLNRFRVETTNNLADLNEHLKLIECATRTDSDFCLLSRGDNCEWVPTRIGEPDTSQLNLELNFQANVTFLRAAQNLFDFNLGTVTLDPGHWPDPQRFSSPGETLQEWLSFYGNRLLGSFSLPSSYNESNLLSLILNKSIILADAEESWLRKFSLDGVQLGKTNLKSVIGGFCFATNNRIIVTLPSVRQMKVLNLNDFLILDIRKTLRPYRAVAATTNSFLLCFAPMFSSVDILSLSNGFELIKSVKIPSVHLPDPNGCTSLAISANKNFLMVDSIQNRLLCFDTKGNFKFVYEGPETLTAVCTDNNYIYFLDASCNTVFRLNFEGQLDCALITAEDGLDNPISLNVDDDKHLVVVQATTPKSVLTFKI